MKAPKEKTHDFFHREIPIGEDRFRRAGAYGASSSYPGDYAVFQSRTGIQFWNLTDVRNPKLIKDLALPTINGGGYDNGVFCVFWQAP